MKIYHFDPATGEYLTTGRADPSPLEPDIWLVPKNATSLKPPSVSDGAVAAWNGTGWISISDHRGEIWWKDGEAQTIVTIGDPSEGGYSSEGPPTPGENQTVVWELGQWVMKPDHRGETWWDSDGLPITIADIGDPSELGYSNSPPPPSNNPNDYTLSRRQIRAALVIDGRPASFVDDVIAGIPEGIERELAKIDWEDAPYYKRDHPLVASLGLAAGFTSAQMDSLWMAAKDLPQ